MMAMMWRGLVALLICAGAARAQSESTPPHLKPATAADQAVTKSVTDAISTQLLSLAPLASPALTGTPTAPTPATADNSTRISTTAFIDAYVASLNLLSSSVAASTYAPIASPAFTGAPTSTTPATADNSTKIATTAWVKAQGYGAGASLPPSIPFLATNGSGTGVAAAYTPLNPANNLSDVASAPAALGNLGGLAAAQKGAASGVPQADIYGRAAVPIHLRAPTRFDDGTTMAGANIGNTWLASGVLYTIIQNATGRAVWLITPTSLPVDALAAQGITSEVAYGSVPLSSAAVNAFVVTRASDLTTKQITFVSRALDYATADAFCAGTNCYITTSNNQNLAVSGEDATCALGSAPAYIPGQTVKWSGLRPIVFNSQAHTGAPTLNTMTASASGTVLTVTAIGTANLLQAGEQISGTGVTTTMILGQLSGVTGGTTGTSTWRIANSQTFASTTVSVGAGPTALVYCSVPSGFSWTPNSTTVFFAGQVQASVEDRGIWESSGGNGVNTNYPNQTGTGIVWGNNHGGCNWAVPSSPAVWYAQRNVSAVACGGQNVFTTTGTSTLGGTAMSGGNIGNASNNPGTFDLLGIVIVPSGTVNPTPVLNGLQVASNIPPQARNVVVFEGASGVVGTQSRTDYSPPRVSLDLLNEPVLAYNAAVFGTNGASITARCATNNQYGTMFQPTAHHNIFLLYSGVTDIQAGLTDVQTESYLSSWSSCARGYSGANVVLSTLFNKCAISINPSELGYLQSVNNWLLAGSSGADKIVDVFGDPTIGPNAYAANDAITCNVPNLWAVSNDHLTDYGAIYWGQVQADVINALLN